MRVSRVRVGLVGTGVIAQVMHLHYLAELADRYEVAAVCDLDADSARACAGRYGIPAVFTDWRDLLGRVKLMVGYPKRYDPAFARMREETAQLTGARMLRVTTFYSDPDALVGALPQLDAVLDTFDLVQSYLPGPPPRPTLADSGSKRRNMLPARSVRDQSLGFDADGWKRFAASLARVIARCRDRGYEPTFHPETGTYVEAPWEIERVLEVSDIGLCLETGHMMLGGGDPVMMLRDLGDRVNHVHLKDDDWRFDRAMGGTTIADLGCHLIDMTLTMADPVESTCAQATTFVRSRSGGTVTVDDAASALLRFESGALGTLEVARAAVRRPCDFTVEANGSRGTLMFDYARLNELWYASADDDVRLYGMRRIRAEHPSHPYAAQWWPIGQGVGYGASFANQVADLLEGWPEAPWTPGFREGAAVQAVCAAMETSAEGGRWVTIGEVTSDVRKL